MESKKFLLALVKDSEWYSDREFWNCEMELPREVMSFAPANVTVAAFVIRSQKIWYPHLILFSPNASPMVSIYVPNGTSLNG
jgi:hypothetical protein